MPHSKATVLNPMPQCAAIAAKARPSHSKNRTPVGENPPRFSGETHTTAIVGKPTLLLWWGNPHYFRYSRGDHHTPRHSSVPGVAGDGTSLSGTFPLREEG